MNTNLSPVQILIFTDDNSWTGFARYAGAYRIASELRASNYSVKVVDFFSSYSIDQLKNILDRYTNKESLFIGFATSLWVGKGFDYRDYLANSYEAHLRSLFPHADSIMSDFFEHAKSRCPTIRFVVGGSKAESFSNANIHHWILGEGERSALFLAEKLSKKEYDSPKVMQGKDLPFLDFKSSRIDWHPSDFIFPQECLPIEIARGCIFRCSFCYYPLNGKKKGDYIKDADHLFQEIEDTNKLYGTETFLFTDDLINESLEKVKAIHSISKSLNFKLEWSGFCRLDLIHAYPQMLELLVESGLKSVFFGIETLDQVAGSKSGKGLGKKKIIETLQKIKASWGNQVMINAGFIVGLPGETRSSVEETLDWLLEDDCPVDVADVSVLNIKARPGLKEFAIYNSPIGENPEKYGITLSSNKWHNGQMSSDEAYSLVNWFYSNPKFLNKKRGAPFTMYPRLKNLGFSYEQIANVTWKDARFMEEAKKRRNKLFQEYLIKTIS